MSLPRLIILVFVLSVLTACAGHVTVNVSAISSNTVDSFGTRYVFASAMRDVDTKDLYFREYSQYFDTILQKKKYIKVTDRQNADLEISFAYAISDGTTGISVFSWPIYETFGGETITITEQTRGPSGKLTTTTRQVHIPVRVQRIGTEVQTRSYTLYNRTATLEARVINKDGSIGDVVWMVLISSIGSSSDLRGTMPYLAAASAEFIGINTGEQRKIVVNRKDPFVLELKSSVR